MSVTLNNPFGVAIHPHLSGATVGRQMHIAAVIA